jgi:Cu/Ag efflux protein CusF
MILLPNPRCVLVFAVLVVATSAGTTRAEEATTIRGSVVKVDAAAKHVTVRPADGKDVVVAVTAASRLEAAGKPVTLDQFKNGQRVRVTYAARDGVNEIVRLKPAVTTDEELGREVKQALAAARSYTFEQKDKYEARLRDVADDIDDRIDRLEVEAKDAGAEAKAKLRTRIDDLKKRRGALNGRLAKVQSATADAWDDIKAGVGAAVYDLEKTLGDLFKN